MYSAELRSTLPVHRQTPWRAREAMDEAGLSKPMGDLKAQSAALLRSLFLDFQPASVGIPKHVPQISNLIGCHLNAGWPASLPARFSLIALDLLAALSGD